MREEYLHGWLDMLIGRRRACQKPNASPVERYEFARLSLLFVRDLMGEDLFKEAMKSGEPGSGLWLFANRVQLLKPLLEDNWPEGFTFAELEKELFALAGRDEPRILAPQPKQGRFPNAHALLERKLEAHVWYRVLAAMKVPTVERQQMILEHFRSGFEAYRKWLSREAYDNLGREWVDGYIADAVRQHLAEASIQLDSIAWAKGEMQSAGEAYVAELYRLPPSDKKRLN